MCKGSGVCKCHHVHKGNDSSDSAGNTSGVSTNDINNQASTAPTGVNDGVSVVSAQATGVQTIDALLSDLKYAPNADGISTTITYSFGGPNSVYSTDNNAGYGGANTQQTIASVTEVSETTKELFRNALDQLSRFTNLEFQEVQDTALEAGTIRMAWTGEQGSDAVGFAYLPSNTPIAGDIWLVSENHEESDVDFGHTVVHELGHALGLGHSFENGLGGVKMPSNLEGVEFTVMSYTVTARFSDASVADLWPSTFMYYDIKALQQLYGVDTVTTAGGDTYTYSASQRYLETLWDYGGNDTLAVTGSKNVHLNLQAGTWSNIGTDITYTRSNGTQFQDSYTLYIADDTTIENATGASGDDTLQGNDAANRLIGNEGDDRMEGGAGNDVLRGDAGADQSFGGSGDDQLWAGSDDNGNDTVAGGSGNDTVAGANGDDLLVGGSVNDGATKQLVESATSSASDGSDVIFGGQGADTLVGGGWDDSAVSDNGRFDHGEQITDGTGNDVIWAGTEDDVVYGANGNDVIGGGQGDDTVYAGGGNDLIFGGKDSGDTGTNDYIDLGAGDDVVYASAGADQLFGQEGDDDLFSGAGNDTVDGGAGDDTLWGGGGDDSFTGGDGVDTFVFASGHGDDRVEDFSTTEDILYLVNAATDFQSVADVEAAATEQSGGVLIDIGGGDSVFLTGLSTADLSTINYVFN